MKNIYLKKFVRVWTSQVVCFVLITFSGAAVAQTITEIIDATGDGAGNTLTNPLLVTVDGSDNVYVASVGGNSKDVIFKITPSGGITKIIDFTGDGAGNMLKSPRGIAVDGSGNVYVTGWASDNAFKITPGGVITKIIDATGDGSGYINNKLDAPWGIAVDGSGNVYVAGYGNNNAFKITPGGDITMIIDGNGDGAGNKLNVPTGIAVDGTGNVYLTGRAYNNAFKITPGGDITEIIDGNGDWAGNYLGSPDDIAVDGSGNVYVAGWTSLNAFKITPNGAITEIIDATGDGTGNALNRPQGLAVDGSGNVYVSSRFTHSVFKITPDGVITMIIEATGDGAGNTLDSPMGVAADGFGNVYVTGFLSHNVFKIGPAVSPTGTVSGTISVNSNGLENILVKLLDDLGLPVDGFDDIYTDGNGEYSFVDVPVGDYQVMIVEPLGYIVDLNPKPAVVVGNETTIVDFNFTEVVVLNNARSKGYWKHQFDVYVKGRGNAQESEQDLQAYIDLVHQHYTLYYDIFTDVNTFEEWQAILSLKGNHPMADRAKQHLSALILNMVSNKIGQYTIVTEDGRDVGDVVQYVSELIIDGDDTNDELAKDLAESVNNQQMIAAGIVPEGSIVFKTGNDSYSNVITTYELYDSYPNPFNPSTKIVYQIPERGNVLLKVYDMLGKEVTTLVEEYRDEGRYEINFVAGNLASGIYIYQLRANNYIATKKMILMK